MTKGLDESHTDYRCEENSVLVATECHGRSCLAKSVPRYRGLPWTDGILCYNDVHGIIPHSNILTGSTRSP